MLVCFDIMAVSFIDPDICLCYDEISFKNLVSTNSKLLDSFSMLHVNIRSIPKNFGSLEQYLFCLQFDFTLLGITETWHVDLFERKGYHSVHSYVKPGGVEACRFL
jgi:hypothetical protein